nr:ATP-binding protein [Oceanobacillus alkalisoli]
MTTLLVLLSVLASLVAAAIFLHQAIENREHESVNTKLKNIGRMVAKDPRVIEGVTDEALNDAIQLYAKEVEEATDISFVVVLDDDLIRKSHPQPEVIGEPFSNLEDAARSLNGTEHYSQEEGVLGEGTRFFTPIWNAAGEQIGVVCVGFVQENVNQALSNAYKSLYAGLLFGLAVGLIGAFYLARQLKKLLWGMEPKEIVLKMKERDQITDSVSEGIIAVSPNREVLLQNNNFIDLMNKAGLQISSTESGFLGEEIFSILFEEVFEKEKPLVNEQLVLNQLELIANVKLVHLDGETYGAVATLRDQSEFRQLARELSGTTQYIDSLRAQNHKFMNQLHTILGLIELEKYDDVEKFIRVLNMDYHEEIGFVTDKIKSPAIAGFLLGKRSELREQGVELTIDEYSHFPNIKMDEILHDLLLSIGILLDNAKEAVSKSEQKHVTLFLKFDTDEAVIMIEVEDTGSGIENEYLEKIFERGFSTKGETRGYGLDAVQTIANHYDGIVDVQSSTESGSIFRVELPYRAEETDGKRGYR